MTKQLRDLIPRDALEHLDRTEFLARCRKGSASRRELETFLVQHYFYARHFTRYLCALLVNLESDNDRLVLTENLFEEMGLGTLGTQPHSKIYRDMLTAFGLEPDRERPLNATKELISGMLRFCSSGDAMMGLAALCLGAEAIVPHVYRQILHGLLAGGFPLEKLEFFPLHIDGDDEHAQTMMRIIERELERDPTKAVQMANVAHEIIEMRARFFDAIVSQATETNEVHHAV
jgi:pyrroloquinoline quinone (PQQ) biosynthesis protein C